MSANSGPLARYVRSFLPAAQPWITRQSYRHELVAAFTLPAAFSLVEGGVIGVLATKIFNFDAILFAVIQTAPMFAHLTSFFWARVARGRSKVKCITALQIALLFCIAGIGFMPISETGSLMLVGLIVIARCLLAGIVTLRSTIWRQNYPRAVRASVTGRLTLVATILMAVTPLVSYWLLDLNPQAFRWIYPGSLLVAVAGVIAFSRVRMRGQREMIAFESQPNVEPSPHGVPTPIYEYDPTDKPDQPNTFWSVLKHDRYYRSYMTWQFVAGAGNMTAEVVLIYYIAERTRGMSHEFLISICLTSFIPLIVMVCTLPTWAKYFDKTHIADFRVRQGKFWIADQGLNFVSLATGLLPLLAVGRVIQGIARGAGALAWQLGHNDFADRKLVAIYMGIHMTLTGVRGAICPIIGMVLFAGWSGDSTPDWLAGLPKFEGIGHYLFLLTFASVIIAEFGFRRLARSIPQSRRLLQEDRQGHAAAADRKSE